jgi:shikimate 5-dehydrogenase
VDFTGQGPGKTLPPRAANPVPPKSIIEVTSMATDLAGKAALITGAGRGIGRATALGLADAGAQVILLARTAGQLEETRALLRDSGVPAQRIRVVPADLADEDRRGDAMATVLARRAASTSWSTTPLPSSRSAPPSRSRPRTYGRPSK